MGRLRRVRLLDQHPGHRPRLRCRRYRYDRLQVNIPAASGTGTGTPTGTVFNSSSNLFMLTNGSAASFLFASLDGTISGWNGALGTANSIAQIAINNSANNAVYTDIALLTNSTGTFLLAANFGQGTDIEIYDSTFKAATLAGSFTDPTLPANYAPFAVHTIGSQVFVTYALRANTTTSPTSPSPYAVSSSTSSPRAAAITYSQTVGAGNGIVDVFDLNGNFVARAITGGNLNAPWGVALAPAGFGNFGDGMINVYNPTTFAFLGQLTDATGKALSYPSLWEITFGESNAIPVGAGDPNTLYIAAGLTNEAHGLFAGIANTTTSTAAATFGFSSSASAATVTAGNSTTAIISAAPTNGFSGSVALSCNGPVGVTCSFSPSQLTVSPTAAATSTVTIQTSSIAAPGPTVPPPSQPPSFFPLARCWSSRTNAPLASRTRSSCSASWCSCSSPAVLPSAAPIRLPQPPLRSPHRPRRALRGHPTASSRSRSRRPQTALPRARPSRSLCSKSEGYPQRPLMGEGGRLFLAC
jgi:hypothetical protein